MKPPSSLRPQSRRMAQRGIMLLEVTVALGLTIFVALIMMKGSLLAVSGNQWTILQTLSDAYLTRETALSNRVPMADLTGPDSGWPDASALDPAYSIQTVTLGTLPGGRTVSGQLTRFRLSETQVENTDTTVSVWRLHSVLSYTVGEHQYVKSRSTLRTL